MTNKQDVAGFPDTYKIYNVQHLLGAFVKGPLQIRRAIDDLSEKDLTHRLRGINTWSIQEIVLHLADSELMGAARFKQCISQSGRSFAFYNQDVWAEKFNYNEYSSERFYKAIDLFELLRWHTYQHLINIHEDDWKKTAIHYQRGEMTLLNLLQLYADHSERHLSQINDCREKLGKSSIPLLLETRLY